MRIIKLQIYKGLKLLFNEQGKVENKNQSIKLVDGEEWLNYLSFIKSQQLCKVVLISVNKVKNGTVTPVDKDVFAVIAGQLKAACVATKDSPVELRLELSDPGVIENPERKITGKTATELNIEKKAIRDALKARAAAGNLHFRKTMTNAELEKLLIDNKL